MALLAVSLALIRRGAGREGREDLLGAVVVGREGREGLLDTGVMATPALVIEIREGVTMTTGWFFNLPPLNLS